jgi:hypothetical protein
MAKIIFPPIPLCYRKDVQVGTFGVNKDGSGMAKIVGLNCSTLSFILKPIENFALIFRSFIVKIGRSEKNYINIVGLLFLRYKTPVNPQVALVESDCDHLRNDPL